tara:strand:+ start:613 stop:801 length:189 start_codon:yes stop_codon:yes gene_type:complete
MKLHQTLVEKLIVLFEVNSGWPEQKKLKEALTKLDLTVYKQSNGNEVLVSTKQLKENLNKEG